jgi:hypothetical protein
MVDIEGVDLQRGGLIDPPDFGHPFYRPRLADPVDDEARKKWADDQFKRLMEAVRIMNEQAEHERRIQQTDSATSLVRVSPKKQAFNTITDALEQFEPQERLAIMRSVLAYFDMGTIED